MTQTAANFTIDDRVEGLDPQRLQKLADVLSEDVNKGLYDGGVIMVGRNGGVGLKGSFGHSVLGEKRPADLDDVWYVFSFAKTMTTAMVLALIDQGELTLTTPVVDIIPEFGSKGKHRVNIGHLLTHTGGMPNDLPMIPFEKLGDLDAFVAGVCEQRLERTPGSKVQYSSFSSHAILADVARRLDPKSRSFRDILTEDFFQPLGMSNTSVGKSPELADRLVPVVVRDRGTGLLDPELMESINFILTEDAEMPSIGVISTVEDIFRWAEFLRCRGEYNGTRLLSQAIIDLAVSNHTGDMPNRLYDYAREQLGWPEFPAFHGLSFPLRGEGIFPTPFGLTASPGTYGGICLGSGMFWVDPQKDLTFVCLTSGLMEESASTTRFQKLADLAISAVVD